MLDKRRMLEESTAHMEDLKIGIGSMTQSVETLSGGQRQGVAVARSAAFARHVVIMDEPTAALGVKESNTVLELIRRVRDRGLSVVLISHDMPHVFEVADRIHVARLGKRVAVLNPRRISMSDTVAVMTGALRPEAIACRGVGLATGATPAVQLITTVIGGPGSAELAYRIRNRSPSGDTSYLMASVYGFAPLDDEPSSKQPYREPEQRLNQCHLAVPQQPVMPASSRRLEEELRGPSSISCPHTGCSTPDARAQRLRAAHPGDSFPAGVRRLMFQF